MAEAGDEAAPAQVPIARGPSIFARAAEKIDEQIMRMIEKDDAFEGLAKKKAHKVRVNGDLIAGRLKNLS